MTAPWLAAAVTAGYMLATAAAFRLIDLGVPAWLETLLSALAAPGALALLVWSPVLRRLGLSDGEIVSVPNPVAFVMLTLFYAALAFVVMTLVMRLLPR